MTMKNTTPFAIAALAGLAASGAVATARAQAQQPGAEPTAALEEVLVTTRRREENLQDVPAAVSAFSADQLRELAITNLEDINSLAPNIKVNPGRATSNTINAYIRGVGQNDPLWGFEPGVGIYIDDVYIARPQGALLDVYDVQRIEILRGPQGTLYGKNTLAGAIKYVTRDIIGKPAFDATLALGSYGQIDMKLAGSRGFGEHVYVGGSLAKLTRNGFGEVVADANSYQFNHVGEDVSDKNILAGRGEVDFLWGDSSRLRIMGDFVKDTSNVRGGQRLNDVFGPRLPSRYDVRNDMPVNEENFENKGISATYTVNVNDQWAVKAVGAYREGDGTTFLDFETLNVNQFNVPAEYADHQGSGELQLTYTGGRFKAVGGLYYFDGTAAGSFDAVLGTFPLFGGLIGLTQGSVATESYAGYIDGTFALTDRWNLNFGARYNEDKKKARVFVAQLGGQIPSNGSAFDPANLPTGVFALGAPQSNYTSERTDNELSPKLGVDFRFTDDVMAYAQYSEGFKSGGFDMRGNATVFPGTVDGYKPETVDNYELGLRSTLLNGRLRFNATVFYADYKDVQVTTQQFVTVMGVPTNATAVLNAGKQVNQGVEIESVWQPVDAFTLSTSIGYLDAEFKEFFASNPASPGTIVNYASVTPVINAPEWTFSTDAQYRFNVLTGQATARLGFQWRDDTSIAPPPFSLTSPTDQPAYGLLDLGLSYVTADSHWRVALDAKNVTDKWYRTAGYDFGTTGLFGNVSQIGYYGPPRTYTLSLRYSY
ncbi:MAG: Pesticin receptor [Steroidobacteraceae bacterium]|nr:Pesticin receptor [Steroidobacteraceae bacterium]